MKLAPCLGCGGLLEEIDGPTHRYMESSPGCWAAYGEVLAREYASADYFEVHRLPVDAYAVQHPGRPSRQSIQSIALHLIRLYLLLERGLEPASANDAMRAAAKLKRAFPGVGVRACAQAAVDAAVMARALGVASPRVNLHDTSSSRRC